MYDEISTPIPNLDQYLERINLRRPDICDLEFLDSMILAHQFNVPFENLDSHDEKLPVSLSTEKLFDKIVTRKRGGYCFELNALFANALSACGYDIIPCLARVVVGDDFSIPSLHRLTIVNLDNKQYVCDVGFGGAQPGFALKLEDGFRKTDNDQTFKIDKVNDRWQISYLPRSGDAWQTTMEFVFSKVEEVDFIAPNFYCYAHEDSYFVQCRVINLKTHNGSISILDDVFAVNENGNRTETKIENEDHLYQILASKFGIKK